ncbi:hypothetical protein ACKGJO_04565 [Gracilimonas sp. Q87]|uniref:hypothetical protein n=1 Tax=Gracilimonas sp. Q87 TaxID=3384766 RepID=UPI003983E3DD
MGQQQLLLVILVTIIVGIATVVAINTFGSAADSANLDAVRQDVAQIAASAQGYYMKPKMLGGGGKDFTGVTFENISFSASDMNADGTIAWNENGTYEITATTAPSGTTPSSISISATPSSSDGYVQGATGSDPLTATIEPDNMRWGS